MKMHERFPRLGSQRRRGFNPPRFLTTIAAVGCVVLASFISGVLVEPSPAAAANTSVSILVNGYSGSMTVTTSGHSLGTCSSRAGQSITVSSGTYTNCSGNTMGTPDGLYIYALSVPSGYHVTSWTMGGSSITSGSASCGSSYCYLNYSQGWTNIYVNLASDYQSPSGPYLQVNSKTSSSVSLSWSSGSPGSGTSYGYNLYKSGSFYTSYSTGTRGDTITGLSCNTNYTFYVQLSSSAGAANSNSVSAKTSSCPSNPPPPTPKPPTKPPIKPKPPTSPTTPTSPPSSPTSPVSGGGSSSSGTPSKTIKPKPPKAPTGFVASPQDGSSRIELSWDTVTDDSSIVYKLERSTDSKKWAVLAEDLYFPQYSDTTTQYATKYYYRLTASDADSQLSAKPVSAQATSAKFAANAGEESDLTLTSDDGIFTAVIKPNSLTHPANCSLSTVPSELSLPKDYQRVAGAYVLACQEASGSYITEFAQPISASLDLGKLATDSMAFVELIGYVSPQQLNEKITTINNKDTVAELNTMELNYIAVGKSKTVPIWVTLSVVLVGLGIVVFLGLLGVYRWRVISARKLADSRALDYWRQEHGLER